MDSTHQMMCFSPAESFILHQFWDLAIETHQSTRTVVGDSVVDRRDDEVVIADNTSPPYVCCLQKILA